jgi:transcriptional regulator with XRE-family HTH domain
MSILTHIIAACITRNACNIDILRAGQYDQSMALDPLYKTIGAVIRSRRKTLGLRQEELARTLGIARGSLANIETGRQGILVHQLYRFAQALAVTPVDLLPPSTESPKPDFAGLPLPADLKPQQREQIARLLDQVETPHLPTIEAAHAKNTKR